jgi:hypothetical protein
MSAANACLRGLPTLSNAQIFMEFAVFRDSHSRQRYAVVGLVRTGPSARSASPIRILVRGILSPGAALNHEKTTDCSYFQNWSRPLVMV